MPMRFGPAKEYLVVHCPSEIVKFVYTDRNAIDKIIGTLERLKIYYGGATTANSLVKDAATMFIGWIFATRNDVPLKRIDVAIDAFRKIKTSLKRPDEKAQATLFKIIAIMRECRSTENNDGFYLPGPVQISALEATQGSFNVLWLRKICQAAAVMTVNNESAVDCGPGMLASLETLMNDHKALTRFVATLGQDASSTVEYNLTF